MHNFRQYYFFYIKTLKTERLGRYWICKAIERTKQNQTEPILPDLDCITKKDSASGLSFTSHQKNIRSNIHNTILENQLQERMSAVESQPPASGNN